MKTKLRHQLLQEAIRIGDALLARADLSPQGLSWKSVDQQGEQIRWQTAENIYQGVGGIVLFLAQLYRQTRQEKYRQAALAGGSWLAWHCREHRAGTPAFLTGRLSVSYVFLQLHQLSPQAEYLQKALDVAQACLAQPAPPLLEYINGAAGTLLCLLHLHAATRASWLLTYIDQYTGLLLGGAQLGPKGLYWDRAPVNSHGLCGFSHGAAGIGYVLLELGHYFRNPAFYWLAEQAFAYEAQHYDPEAGNWPDFRKMILTEQDAQAFRQAYEGGNLSFFTAGSSMNAWCHGAAGIGLTRLRAYELLRQPRYAAEARQALAHTRAGSQGPQRPPSFTLCHGGGGNAELFLKAYEVFADPAYRQLALAVAKEALQARKEASGYLSGTKYPGEDTSLFMGNAGIGYFYLRLLQPRQVPSVLLPVLPDSTPPDVAGYSNLRVTVGAVQRQLAARFFPRTLHLLENRQPREVAAFFGQRLPAPAFPADFLQWVGTRVALLPPPQGELLAETWQTEERKFQLDTHICSDALLSYKNARKAERAAQLEACTDAALAGVVLAADPDMALIRPQWPGQPPVSASEPAGGYVRLLLPSLAYTRELELSDFTAAVLAAFAEAKTVAAAVAQVLADFEELPPSAEARVCQLILAQIRQAIRSGLLLEPGQHPLRVVAPLAAATTPAFQDLETYFA